MKIYLWLASVLLSTNTLADTSEVQVEQLAQRYLAAVHDFDQKQLEALLADDYVEVSPVGEVDSREKVIGFYNPQAKAAAGKTPVMTISEFTTRRYDALAVSIGKVSFDLTLPDGSQSQRAMRLTLMSRYNHDQWKIVSAVYTPIRVTTNR